MPTGYSFIEAFWKRREKEKFLKENLSDLEKKFYDLMDHSIIIGMVALFFYSLFIFLSKSGINYLMLIMALANFLGSFIKQNYRTIMLIKYGYFKKPKIWQNLLWIAYMAIVALIRIVGLLWVLYYFSTLIN